MNLDDLRKQFNIPGVKFDDFAGGLIRVCVKTAIANGELFLHGAHCAGWQPAGHEEVLWMSQESHYQTKKPLRGGVPLCFPWFGPHPTDSTLPAHGSARLRQWDLAAIDVDATGAVRVTCTTRIDPFELKYEAFFGTKLTLSLTTSLPATHPRAERFEDALHTYFSISSIHQIQIKGLEKVAYIDKMAGAAIKPATGCPIEFTCETDRIYFDTQDACQLHDPGWSRCITVAKRGSASTIVWNPWIEKSARMADFGDEEWTGMVCIETGNVGANAIELAPGQEHTTQAILECKALEC